MVDVWTPDFSLVSGPRVGLCRGTSSLRGGVFLQPVLVSGLVAFPPPPPGTHLLERDRALSKSGGCLDLQCNPNTFACTLVAGAWEAVLHG